MTECIRRATSEILLLHIFVVSTAICFLSVKIFVVEEIEMTSLLKLAGTVIILLFYLYMFSLYGTRIMEANFRVATEISHIDWFRMRSTRLKKYLIIIMCMGQKRIGIKIGKFCFVTLPTFSDIVNSVFSYFSTLRGLLKGRKWSYSKIYLFMLDIYIV